MKDLNTFQKYFVEEFYDDYREGLLSRRQFIRRVAFITGSMAATASTLSLLGCSPAEIPATSEPMPSPTSPPAVPTATTAAAATATTPRWRQQTPRPQPKKLPPNRPRPNWSRCRGRRVPYPCPKVTRQSTRAG